MNRSRARRAFTIVELLVALVLMGVASAGLAGALAGDRRLRSLAGGELSAAARVRERLELLAGQPCLGETSGSSVSPWGSERWRAVPSQSAWHVTDSLLVAGSVAPLLIEARVACPS